MASTPPGRPLPAPTHGIRVDVRPPGVVVHLSGDLDAASAATVEAALRAVVAARPGQLDVDVRGVSFCDVVGASVLLRVRDHARDAGTPFRVVAVPDPLVRLWCLLHLTPAGSGAELFRGAAQRHPLRVPAGGGTGPLLPPQDRP